MNERKYSEGVINDLTLWINNNLARRLSIDDIAAKSGYSKWYIQKLFSLYRRQTLARYIRQRKLAASVCDLKGSELPIINIAVKYHFESQQSFTRSFKQITGCTPRLCRQYQTDAETLDKMKVAENPCTLCLLAGTAPPPEHLRRNKDAEKNTPDPEQVYIQAKKYKA